MRNERMAEDKWTLATLAPSATVVPETMSAHIADPDRRNKLLASVQRFRGKVYLEDGAIQPWQLTSDGRHMMEVDEAAWHIVAVTPAGDVCGCQRYVPHPTGVSYSGLGVSTSSLARSAQWGPLVQTAIENQKAKAESTGVTLVEAGGWALAPAIRGTLASLKLALAPYSLARVLGGCIGLGTATHRHDSYSILKRIGGRALDLDGVEFPEYFDPQYKCKMEILVFDSSKPNPKYESWIEEIRASILVAPVISDATGLQQLWAAVSAPALPTQIELRQHATVGAR